MAGSYIGTAPATRDPEVSNDSVGTSKIIDDAVTAAKVAYIGDSLATTSGNNMVADGSDFGNVAMSVDATISSAGAVTIANDAVDSTKLDHIFTSTTDGIGVVGTFGSSTQIPSIKKYVNCGYLKCLSCSNSHSQNYQHF